MIGGRVELVWLARHPTAAVFVSLAVIAAFSASLAWAVSGPSSDVSRVRSDAQEAPYTLPTPTQHPSKNRVDAVHKALHAFGRACKTPISQRDPAALRKPLDLMEAFATDFPSGGFRIDDEPGTTLALLIVIFDELQTCDPSMLPEIEALIPAEYHGG